jgi:uncharacterized protein (DUF2342 family)
MKERIRKSNLRADTAHALVNYAIAHTSFSVRAVERDLQLSYGRANSQVGQLVQLGILSPVNSKNAPEAFDVLVNTQQIAV